VWGFVDQHGFASRAPDMPYDLSCVRISVPGYVEKGNLECAAFQAFPAQPRGIQSTRHCVVQFTGVGGSTLWTWKSMLTYHPDVSAADGRSHRELASFGCPEAPSPILPRNSLILINNLQLDLRSPAIFTLIKPMTIIHSPSCIRVSFCAALTRSLLSACGPY